MTCKDVEDWAIERSPASLHGSLETNEHIRGCPYCTRIFGMDSEQAAAPTPETIQRITARILPALRPVRPIAAPWMPVSILVLACAALALLGADLSGFGGLHALGTLPSAIIFPTLVSLTVFAAWVLQSEVTPGSKRFISPGLLLASGAFALAVEFSLLLHNHGMTDFAAEGKGCLINGVVHALPVGIVIGFALHRCFALDPVRAGLAAGALAGLGGVELLELHCPNLELMHQMIWHLAVIPVTGALGALWGWVVERSRLRELPV